MNTRTAFAVALLALSSSSCDRNPDMVNAHSPRTVTLAQTGQADVVGNDSAALAKAVALLHAGDTLSIGPGTYEMQDSLRVPSSVTVRGTGAETILKILLQEPRRDLSQTAETGFGVGHIFREQSFLRAEDSGAAQRTKQRVFHIHGHDGLLELYWLIRRLDGVEAGELIQSQDFFAAFHEESPPHPPGQAKATVIGGTAADSNEAPSCSGLMGGFEH